MTPPQMSLTSMIIITTRERHTVSHTCIFMFITSIIVLLLSIFTSPSTQSQLIDTNQVWRRNQVIQLGSDLIIGKNTSLIIESGVTVRISPQANILVYGFLRVEGTELEPVHFQSVSRPMTMTNNNNENGENAENVENDDVEYPRWGFIEFMPSALSEFFVSDFIGSGGERGTVLKSELKHVVIRDACKSQVGGSIIVDQSDGGGGGGVVTNMNNVADGDDTEVMTTMTTTTRTFSFVHLTVYRSGGIEADDRNMILVDNCRFSSDRMGVGFGTRGGLYVEVKNSVYDGYAYGIVLENFVQNGNAKLHLITGNRFVNNAFGIQPRSSAIIEDNTFEYPSSHMQRMVSVGTDFDSTDLQFLIIQNNRFDRCQYDTIFLQSYFNYLNVVGNSFTNCFLSFEKPLFRLQPNFRSTISIVNNVFENITAVSINEYSFMSLGSPTTELDVQVVGNTFHNIRLPDQSTLLEILNTDMVVIKRNTFSKITVRYLFIIPQVRDVIDAPKAIPLIDASQNRYVDIMDHDALASMIKNFAKSRFAYIALYPLYFGLSETETYPQFSPPKYVVTGQVELSGTSKIPAEGRIYEAGSRLTILPGTVLTLNGPLIVLGELIMKGTEDKPITIYGSDYNSVYLGSTVVGTTASSDSSYLEGSIIEHVNFLPKGSSGKLPGFILSIINENYLLINKIKCDLSIQSFKLGSCISIKQLSKTKMPSIEIKSSTFSNSVSAVWIRGDREMIVSEETEKNTIMINSSTFQSNTIGVICLGVQGSITNSYFTDNTDAIQSSYAKLVIKSNNFNVTNAIQDLNSYLRFEDNSFSNTIYINSFGTLWFNNKFTNALTSVVANYAIFVSNTMGKGQCGDFIPISIQSNRIVFHKNMIKQHNCPHGVIQLLGESSQSTASVINTTFAANTVDSEDKGIFMTDIANLDFRYNGYGKANEAKYFFVVQSTKLNENQKTLNYDLRYNYWAGLASTSLIRSKIGKSKQKTLSADVAPYYTRASADSKPECDGGHLPLEDGACPIIKDAGSGRTGFLIPIIVGASLAAFLVILILVAIGLGTFVYTRVKEIRNNRGKASSPPVAKKYTEAEAKEHFLTSTESYDSDFYTDTEEDN